MEPSASLEHYGIKGMKWGIRRTPEQLGHVVNKVKKKVASVQKKSAAKKKKAAQKKRKAEREAILRSPTKLYKHRFDFTAQEINDAMKRFEWEKKLKDYSKNNLDRGADYINSILKYANTGINLYNASARVYNTFGEGRVPYIEGVDASKNKKKK